MKLEIELSPPPKSIVHELPLHESQDDDVDQILSQNRRLRHSPELNHLPALPAPREIECIPSRVVLSLKFA